MTEDTDDDAVRAELHALVEGQPDVADWPARVRSTVRLRRQRQAVLTGTAAAVALLLVVGTGLALGGSNDTLEPATAPPTPTASVQPSTTPPAPVPGDTESPATAAPGPDAPERSADATDAPTAQRTSPPADETAAASARPPADRPPRRRVEVRVDVSGPASAEVGTEVVFDVRLRAPEGRPALYSQDFGDVSIHGDPAPCGDPPPTPAPTPYDETTQVRHAFERPGRYEVVFGADIYCQHVDGGGVGRTVIDVTEPVEPSPAPPLSGGFLSTGVREGGEPRPLAPGTRLSVRFDEDADGTRLTWTSGCSRYGAPVVVGEQRLDVKDIATADLECDQEQEEQDEWVRRFFAADPSWELSDDGQQLALTVDDVRIELRRSS